MKDRTIDHSRPDAGEALKDIKTKGQGKSVHANFEKHENYRVDEIAAKVAAWKKAQAQDVPEERITPDEFLRRQERIRKLIGAVLGGVYGTVAGGFSGGATLSRNGNFDKQRAVHGMILGMLAGTGAGYAGGAITNKIKRYTGTHRPEAHAPIIQIVMPPSSQITNQVQDAMKSGSAVAHTLGIFAGITKHSNVMSGMPQANARPTMSMGANLLKPNVTPVGPGIKPIGMGAGLPKPNAKAMGMGTGVVGTKTMGPKSYGLTGPTI